MKDKIVELFERGFYVKDIAQELKIDQRKVSKTLKEEGYVFRGSKLKGESERIIESYVKKNYTIKEIAEHYSVNHNAIVYILKKNNIPRRDCLKFNENQEKKITRLYLEGLTTSELSNKFNVANSTICRILKKHNCKIRTLKESNEINKHFTKSKQGNKNPMWKELHVNYFALHQWLNRNYPKPKHCKFCNKTDCILEYANISGEYKRDIKDYYCLCRSCHTKYDHKKKNKEVIK